MIRKLIYASLTILAAIIAGCNDTLDEKTTLTFVGDSLIARWDLQNSFSSLITYNKGLSGSGVKYLESLAGAMSQRNVVVLTGTNDSPLFTDDETRHQYEQQYISALEALGAKKIYLIEVLPRDINGDGNILNNSIALFNAEIGEMIKDIPDITHIKAYDQFLGKDGCIVEEYYNDRLHLSPQGYEILTNKIFNAL